MSAEASAAERDSNRIIEQQLDSRLAAVEEAANADAIAYLGPMYRVADDQVKDAVEAIHPRRDKLLVILETGGGYVDVAERIARIFRHHYGHVDFLIPNYAMSAGTILAMSGDSILMDYASILGPIDPQIPRGDDLVPALGYLVQYERLIEKSNKGELSTAELAFLLENFDAAELYRYEQERELSIALLQEWLVKYKFKNWTKTETKGKKVTPAMRKTRAREVAEKLNQTDRWHSHSRGIPMEVLQRDLKLLIDDFGADPKLGPALHDYYRLLKNYMMRRDHVIVLHSGGRYVGF